MKLVVGTPDAANADTELELVEWRVLPRSRPAPPEDWDTTHDQIFFPRADEAYIELDAQLGAVQILAKNVESKAAKAYGERCIAHVEGVREALSELHFGVSDAGTRKREWRGSPVIAYLVASYVWCQDMLEALRVHLSRPWVSANARDGALSDHSAAFVVNTLEPLFDALRAHCESVTDPEHPLRRILLRAERVYNQILRVDGPLLAA